MFFFILQLDSITFDLIDDVDNYTRMNVAIFDEGFNLVCIAIARDVGQYYYFFQHKWIKKFHKTILLIFFKNKFQHFSHNCCSNGQLPGRLSIQSI